MRLNSDHYAYALPGEYICRRNQGAKHSQVSRILRDLLYLPLTSQQNTHLKSVLSLIVLSPPALQECPVPVIDSSKIRINRFKSPNILRFREFMGSVVPHKPLTIADKSHA